MRTTGIVLSVFALAFLVYWGTALLFDATQTPDVAYFNQLAYSFLHGRTDLPAPPSTHDLTWFQGRWYAPFPPLPALLMAPWVAWANTPAINTVLFCAIFGAFNVSLIFLLLSALSGRGWSKLHSADHFWLALLFGLGSVHWYMATLGSVWFVAQICTVTFVVLALWVAVAHGSPWLAGGALALAMLARPNVALTWPLLLGIAAMHQRNHATDQDFSHAKIQKRRWLLRWSLASLVPPALAVIALFAYNFVRFGNPFDFGYATENVAEKLAGDLHRYGQFHIHYLAKNFWAMWLAGPRWNEEIHFWEPDGEGLSLLLTTPALIYLGRARKFTPLVAGAWLAFGLLLIPLLLYYNTGWWQFGYRFSLDFMAPVMVLLAVAAGERVTGPMRLLILAGVIANLYGVVWWHAWPFGN
jgi:hypothetical protein